MRSSIYKAWVVHVVVTKAYFAKESPNGSIERVSSGGTAHICTFNKPFARISGCQPIPVDGTELFDKQI